MRLVPTEGKSQVERFLDQYEQVRRCSSPVRVLARVPGLRWLATPEYDDVSAREPVRRAVAIVRSMTPEERRHPELVDGHRSGRIARGSGTTAHDVFRLLADLRQPRR